MPTRDKSARNGAAASYLRGVKASRLEKITYEDISEKTGITVDTLKRLMRNRSEFKVEDFLSIANALGVSDAEALRALAEVVGDQGV